MEDIKASKLLFDSRHYSLSVFHYQQASEKFLKTWGICTGLFSNSEECKKEIGHDPMKFQIKYVKRVLDVVSKVDLGEDIDRILTN